MSKPASIRAGELLMERLRSDRDLLATLEAAESYDALVAMAKTAGFDLSSLSEWEFRALASRARGEFLRRGARDGGRRHARLAHALPQVQVLDRLHHGRRFLTESIDAKGPASAGPLCC